jgi:hypothetical protein
MKFTKKESFTVETLEFAKNLSLQTLTSVPSACLCEHADRRLSGESSPSLSSLTPETRDLKPFF